jgi:cobalt-zinc-cadmium efflux system outer membrane protein
MLRSGWVVLLCALAASACVRDYPPAAVPGATSQPRARAVPLPDPAEDRPLDLAELLAYAEAHAPALAVAEKRAALGDAEVEGASTLLEHNPEASVTLGGRVIEGTTRFEYGAALAQRFEIAGKRGVRIEAAERAREAAGAERRLAGWELHARVHALYYELLVRDEEQLLARRVREFAESIQVITEKRISAGEESPLAEMVARAELAQALQLSIEARRRQRDAELRLAELIGWPAHARLRVAGELPPPRQAPAMSSLLDEAGVHPERARLDASVAAAEARVVAEDREAWPDPQIAVGYAREAEPAAPVHVFHGTLSIPLPIWEHNQGGRARARAERELAQAERRAFETSWRTRVARAAAAVEAAAARAAVFGRDLLPALEEGLAKLRRAFELGEIGVLELAQLRERLLRTQQDALDSLAAYYAALAELEALSGVDRLRGAR